MTSSLSFSVYGQDKMYIQRASLGIHLQSDLFSTTDSSSRSSPNFGHVRLGLAMNYLKGFTPRTDLNATIAASFLDLHQKMGGAGDKHLLLEGDVSIREKIFAGSRHINPFVQAGVGLSQYDGYYGIILPTGAGCQIQLPGETFLLIQAQYRVPLSPNPPGHFYASVGICGIIGKKKTLKSHVLIRHATGMGQPKDSDGDGIPDSIDSCPAVPGLARYQGCPSPDRDNDGVADDVDKCPDLPGDQAGHGCPLVAEVLRKKADIAAKNVFFATDSASLLPASYPALQEVIVILKENPSLLLDIGGHTDNSGSSAKNRRLSDRRAHSVMNYLVQEGGIDPGRLTATGYGADRPVADNSTPAGRALNRRVEFILHYPAGSR